MIATGLYKQAKRQRNDVGGNDMAHAVLLKTDSVTSSNSSQNNIKNRDDETRGESFSSAFGKQVDKQVSQQHDDTNKVGSKEVKSVDNDEQKANKKDDKSGKSLPDKVAETSNETETIDESDVVKKVDTAPVMETEETALEIVSDDPLAIASAGGDLEQNELITAEYMATVNLSGEAEVTKKDLAGAKTTEVMKTSKAVIDGDSTKKMVTELANQQTTNKDTTLEQKQPVTSLRSDILNALLKKPTTINEKSASAIEQKLVASTTLVPVVKGGLSEEQKIMALASTVKSKGLASTAITPERTAGGSAGFAPVITNASSSVAAVMSSDQPTLDLQPGLKSEAWSRVLSSRVIWMAREGVQQASLKLNPANMGPVEVKLHMHNEQANISFIVQHAATRDALEQALPRLRESFQENGMELAHADVSQQDFSQADEQDNNTNNNGSVSSESNTNDDIDTNNKEIQITEHELNLGLSVFV